MSEIVMTKRPSPRIINVEDGHLNWEQVNARLQPSTLIERAILLFCSWKIVLAPIGTHCCITTMGELPIYQYKELKGKVLQLRAAPGPGFPGS